MTQDEFIAAREHDWTEIDRFLEQARRGGLRALRAEQISRFAMMYRALSGDLARAQGARFGSDLVTFLEQLAARAHSTLYAAPPWRLRNVVDFLTGGFPRLLRRRWGFFALAAALFLVPLIVGFVATLISPAFAARVLSPALLENAADSYGQNFGHGRGEGEGAMMTGYYVYNNIGIAFRCFATGIFFGLGSILFLIYNGVVVGTTLGYVIDLGYGANIFSFVAGHAPFELTAIVISGAAGLQMGAALVHAGGETRLGALRRQGAEIFQLVMGAAVMLAVAALTEGFWSSSSLAAPVKLSAGVATAVLVAFYLVRAGRASVQGVR